MKSILYFLLSGFILQAMTCEPDITFYEPQPVDKRSVPAFPKEIQGEYFPEQDSSKLTVSEWMILLSLDHDYPIHLNDLDSNHVISGDVIIDMSTEEKIPFTINGDSIITHICHVDTIFNLSNGHIMKKHKDFYFLNIYHDTEKWEVIKLEHQKNRLILSRINTELELQTLIDITKMPQDTVPPFRFKASEKQFAKFVKNKGFKDAEVYVKK